MKIEVNYTSKKKYLKRLNNGFRAPTHKNARENVEFALE